VSFLRQRDSLSPLFVYLGFSIVTEQDKSRREIHGSKIYRDNKFDLKNNIKYLYLRFGSILKKNIQTHSIIFNIVSFQFFLSI
jgi:hypothetical protein